MPRGSALPVELTEAERETLEMRARIVLLAEHDLTNGEIAERPTSIA